MQYMKLNSAVHSKTYIEEISFLLVGNNMCSVTLPPVLCGDPSTTGNQVMAIIAIMLMIFQSTSKIRAVTYLQMILQSIHLGYFGTHETNCRAFLVRLCLDPWQKEINANKVFIMSIGMTSEGHDYVNTMIYDIHIEQVLSMKYLGTYINNWLSRNAQCYKICPRVPGKIVVLYRIGLFCRSNQFELLYENAKNNPKRDSPCT